MTPISFSSNSYAIDALNSPNATALGDLSLLGQKLQKAIMADDSQALEGLKEQLNSQLLSQALPNGELPLILATTSKKFGALAFLLKSGANPMQRDDQHLNAIEYAKLSPDSSVLTHLIACCVDKDRQTIKRLIENPVCAQAVTTFLTVQNTLEKCLQLKVRETIESHVQQYGTAFASMQHLKRLPAIGDVMAVTGLPFLHLIIVGGHRKLLETYLNQSVEKRQLNQNNTQGFSALFYAVATNRMDLTYDLVSKGADLHLPNAQGVTPLNLAGLSAEQAHPLKITTQEKFFFFCSLLAWSSHFYGQSTVPPVGFLLLNSGITLSYKVISSLNLMHAFKNNFQFLQFYALKFLVQYFAPHSQLTSLFNMGELTALALMTFKGLRSCWRNAHLGRGKALLKALVAHGPSIDQARLKLQFLKTPETTPFPKTEQAEKLSKNQEACIGLEDLERDVCEGWAAKIFETCGYREDSVECTESKRLFEQFQNPCDSSAQILEVDINASKSVVRKAFKKLALEQHPDKNPTTIKEATTKFTEINEAYKYYKDNC